jgi:hypothetical protein
MAATGSALFYQPHDNDTYLPEGVFTQSYSATDDGMASGEVRRFLSVRTRGTPVVLLADPRGRVWVVVPASGAAREVRTARAYVWAGEGAPEP